jgi:hypothetical protein
MWSTAADHEPVKLYFNKLLYIERQSCINEKCPYGTLGEQT